MTTLPDGTIHLGLTPLGMMWQRMDALEENVGRLSLQIDELRRIGLADTDNVFTNEDEEQRAEHLRGKLEALFVARENEFREVGDDGQL